MRSIFAVMCIALALDAVGQGSYAINTVAGSDWVGDGGPPTSAILLQSEGIATDGSGNLYIADAGDHRVRKVASNGVIETVAGTGVFGFSGDGGPAAQAQLNSPYGLALDAQGNLYIADLGNARVRRMDVNGTITTVAGGGALPAGGANDGSPATVLALSAPRNLAFDDIGNLYISDFGGARVYQMSPQGSLSTIAGTGIAGVSGDNGAASQARLNHPAGLAFDPQGVLYVADSANHLVRRIKLGVITSYARAATPTGLSFDGLGTLYVADTSAGYIAVIPVSGPSSTIAVAALDVSYSSGLGLYASTGGTVVAAGGSVPVTLAGGGNLAHGDNGPALQARLNHPAGVGFDTAGNIYIADRDNHRIRRVAAAGSAGTIVTVAGTGTAGNTGDGGPATSAQLNGPSSVTVDSSGNLYIADTGNAEVRKVTPDGNISAAAKTGLVSPVYAIADSSGNLYIADAGAGAILTVGASGVPVPLLSGLTSPRGLALDAQGDILFTDAGAARVASLSPAGTVTNIGPSTGSSWNIPRGVAVDSSGNVWVADTGLQQIIQVDASGALTVIAGTGAAGFSGDGGAATAAQLGFPWDVTVTAGGVALVADLENNRIRALTPPAPALQTQASSSTVPVLGNAAANVSVVNAASLTPGPVAAGMLLLITGTGISPAQIADTAIAFGPNPARILSGDANGILVLTPLALAGLASVSIEILYQNTVIATIPVAVANEAPALFTGPAGQAAANNQDTTLNSQSNPAARGTIISLYGTGLGVSGDPVTVSFDYYTAQVLYAGPVANYPGLFQINARIPSGFLPTGDLTVIVTVGTSPSPSPVRVWVD
jgi:trimeric autotransporter adhesin